MEHKTSFPNQVKNQPPTNGGAAFRRLRHLKMDREPGRTLNLFQTILRFCRDAAFFTFAALDFGLSAGAPGPVAGEIMRDVRTSARISEATLLLLATLAVFGALVFWLARKPSGQAAPKTAGPPLVLYCAAGIKTPVEDIVAEYAREQGGRVQLQYGGSQTLLAGLEVARRGDLYLPADEDYLAMARRKGLVAESIPAARMTAVLAVRRGNPKAIRSLDDLLAPGIALAQANPEAAAVGRITRAALRQSGHWEALEKKTRVFKPTVHDVANDLKLGTVDAGFIWDAMLKQYPELEVVALPQLAGAAALISVGVLAGSDQPTEALRFARFLTATDRGQRQFAQAGYVPAGGDPWAPVPELRLMAGAMLRPAIEETIKQFEKREGVRITRVYNGCGILVAQMRTGDRPDAYFSCDNSFMAQVADLFQGTEEISSNPMIILTQKGNPKGLKTLEDLGRPGLRVGLAHEQQSALGALTKNLLLAVGCYEPVRKNLAVESATGDFLVNQLRVGSLDAVVVYTSNAAAVQDAAEALPINHPSAFAIQPIAVGKQARYPQLAARFQQAVRTAESRQRFLSLGFGWELRAPAEPR